MAFDFTDPRLYRPRAALYALAFEEAGKALDVQHRLLADVRSRAGGVVAVAALVMSILGDDVRPQAATYVAISAFLGVGASALALFWLGHLEMNIDPGVLIHEYAEPSFVPLALVHRDLALHCTAGLARNRRTLERMTILLRLAVGALAVEVFAWVVSYAQAL